MTRTAGNLPRGLRRLRQVPLHLAVALRRVVFERLHLQARVVGLDHLRFEKLRAELIEQHRGGDAADRILGRLVEKAPAIERAVHVGVEQRQQFLVEIMSRLPFHSALPNRSQSTHRWIAGPPHHKSESSYPNCAQ